MLRIAISVSALALFAGSAIAEPLTLTDTQMDGVTAGDLTTPSGQKLFESFDNPNTSQGDPLHPNFGRNPTAFDASENSPNLGGNGNEGPWSAHVMSGGVVICADC